LFTFTVTVLKGKTTALQVAISPFGLPNSKKSGSLLKDWNGTPNAIMGHFRDIHGLPMALDEASTEDGDFSKFVYLLASGKDKNRMNKEGEMTRTAEWDGVILSNAEHSLKSKSKQNIGIQMRLFEIGNVSWTQSAENADALKAGVLNNYGHAGPLFVEHILRVGKAEVIRKWQYWKVDRLHLTRQKS
jgi:putative DNA primase/helicase